MALEVETNGVFGHELEADLAPILGILGDLALGDVLLATIGLAVDAPLTLFHVIPEGLGHLEVVFEALVARSLKSK